jgi:hypothetical protein
MHYNLQIPKEGSNSFESADISNSKILMLFQKG